MTLDAVRDYAEAAVALVTLLGAIYGAFRLAVRHTVMPEIRAIHRRIDTHMDDEQDSMHVMVTSLAYIAGALGLDLSDAFPPKESR